MSQISKYLVQELLSEVVTQKCSVKKVFSEILQNSQENNYARDFLQLVFPNNAMVRHTHTHTHTHTHAHTNTDIYLSIYLYRFISIDIFDTIDLYFAYLERFESHYQFFRLNRNMTYEEKDLKNDGSVEICDVNTSSMRDE